MTGTTQTIMAGDLGGRLPIAGTGDEIDRLAGNLNANTSTTGPMAGNGTINGFNSALVFSSADFVSPGAPNENYQLLATSPAIGQTTGSTVTVDEPAGGVNLTMLAQLRERLAAYHAERNATFVVIEHQMEFVMALCTRILVLAEGSIIAEGEPDDIRREFTEQLRHLLRFQTEVQLTQGTSLTMARSQAQPQHLQKS